MRSLLPVVGILLRLLPKFLYPALAAIVGWTVKTFARKEMARLRSNIHQVYGLPPHSYFSKTFVDQCVRHQVICALETLRAIFDPKAVELVGYDDFAKTLQECQAAGKGTIIAAAHVGSWELVGHYLAKASGWRMQALAKPSGIPGVKGFLEGVRARLGMKVFWTDSRSLLPDILRALKAGEVVGFVMDQKPQNRQGPKVSFMGYETEFVPGPATMSCRVGAGIVSAFCMRVGPWRYKLYARIVVPPNHGRDDVDAMTAELAKEIETIVTDYPEQWTWNYKRWRFDQQPRSLAREVQA